MTVTKGSGRSAAPLEIPRAPGSRMVYLDRLRILLTVLVVLHHVALAYGAGGLDFYFVDLPETFFSRNLLVFVLHNQAWFMGGFFLVAGFFTPGSFDRKGAGSFLSSRIVRLGIPLAIYTALLNPLAMTGWFHMPEDIGRLTWDTFDYWERVRMGPTWFLALLLIFSGAYTVLRVATGRRVPTAETPRAPGLQSVAAFVLLLAGGSYLWRMQIAVGESWGGFPSLGYLVQYLALFGVGIVAYRRGWLDSLRTSTGLVALIAAIGASVFLFPFGFSGEWFSLEVTDALPDGLGGGSMQSAAYALWDSTLAVGLCLGIIVILRSVSRRAGGVGRYLAQTSYATYLVHIPIVTYTAVLLRDVDLSHTGRFLLAAAIAVPVSFLVAGAVRSIPGAKKVL